MYQTAITRAQWVNEGKLPANWNGKFLFQGGGGFNGFIAPSVGSIPSRGATAEPALKRGYAVVSMDGGHKGRDAAFSADQQARLDYAYASTVRVSQNRDLCSWR
ncbi:tannase/feruloyl esterase family alpha/beta hydrolase [Kingella kingae]|nr:tannase/feruloyl esterase family alpha/beta hydrolase [Kingella kingae]MBD3632482.1 tannase/feruloyl esterase family alpha/beta hydrolase [Kingella kingae]MBD3659875.1 tannase/feruloyl esterase family alpha/beta hydrolase [Kingella kingae]QIF41212.1 tannase/feruloyl esterase family alpha/beta hydrolase [Kingella kingae]QIP52199.1 tannase/feruloyl esterase family alpha/beta hydrolase [Kingella kingae]